MQLFFYRPFCKHVHEHEHKHKHDYDGSTTTSQSEHKHEHNGRYAVLVILTYIFQHLIVENHISIILVSRATKNTSALVPQVIFVNDLVNDLVKSKP